MHATSRTRSTTSNESPTQIRTLGIAARLTVGLVLVSVALWWRTPDAGDVLLGLVAMPLLAVGVLAWRARRDPTRLEATGPIAHFANVVVFLPLLFIPATAGAAFLFYGVSMVVAAVRRSEGCEVTAVSNAVLNRDDQVGCIVFSPIDAAEAAMRGK